MCGFPYGTFVHYDSISHGPFLASFKLETPTVPSLIISALLSAPIRLPSSVPSWVVSWGVSVVLPSSLWPSFSGSAVAINDS